MEDTAAGLRNSGSYLGKRASAEDGKDKYDLKAYPGGFDGRSLAIIFPVDGTGEGYNTDYHRSNESIADSWIFVVKATDTESTVTLSWEGLYALLPMEDDKNRVVYERKLRHSDQLLSQMQLVDTVTNEIVSILADNKLQSYTFNMTGKTERTFRWELLEETVSSNIQNETVVSVIKSDAKLNKKSLPKPHKAGPLKPPGMSNN